MYDFNYFQPYHKVKAKTNWSRMLGLLVILAVLVFVAFDAFQLMMTLKVLQADVARLEVRITDPQLTAMVQKVDDAQKKLDGLRFDSFTLGAMQAFVAHESVFDFDKLKTISDRLVEDSYLESIHYSGRQVTLRGFTEKDALTRIAQFVYSLRSSQEFDGFNINLISRPLMGNESLYSFEIGFQPLESNQGNGS